MRWGERPGQFTFRVGSINIGFTFAVGDERSTHLPFDKCNNNGRLCQGKRDYAVMKGWPFDSTQGRGYSVSLLAPEEMQKSILRDASTFEYLRTKLLTTSAKCKIKMTEYWVIGNKHDHTPILLLGSEKKSCRVIFFTLFRLVRSFDSIASGGKMITFSAFR